jgi:hypothetical protein
VPLPALANTGGGGGGGSQINDVSQYGTAGGSGIIIIKWS